MEIPTNLQVNFQFKNNATEAGIHEYANELAKALDPCEQPWMIGEVYGNRLIAWVNVNAIEAVVVPSSPLLDYVRILRQDYRVASNEPLISSEST